MRFHQSLLIALSILGIASTKAQSANLFTYGSNETELYRTTFGGDFDVNQGWTLNNTATTNGVLQATQDNWSSALYNLSSLDLDNGNVGIYWSFKTNRNVNERSKIYLKLDVTNDATRQEQRSITFNVVPKRAGDLTPYQLYIDPGFNLPNQLVQEIRPPSVLFPNQNTFESFRMMVEKIDSNTVQAIPFYWYNNAWRRFTYRNTTITSPVSLTMNINNNLEGLDSFQSLSLLFRSNVPSVDAVAITQIPKLNLAFESTLAATTVPEPTSILGLFVLGILGVGGVIKQQ